MAYPTRLGAEIDSFLRALQPVCDLIEEHALIDTSNQTHLVTLLRRHCEAPGRAGFFGVNLHDFQMITLGLTVVARDFTVVERHTSTSRAYSTALGGAGGAVLHVLNTAESYVYGICDVRALTANLMEAFQNLKLMCARMMRQRTLRSKVLYRDRPEACEAIEQEAVPSTLEDLLGDGGELTDHGLQKLCAFLSFYGDVEGDVRNVFGSLRQCMVPRSLLARSWGNVYKCVRPLHQDIFLGILPIRLFDGGTRYITNLNGLCVQVAGARRVAGVTYVRVGPVGSTKYKDLMTRLEKGEVHATNYSMNRMGGASKAITAQHLLEQHQLDAGAPDLRSKIYGVVSTSPSVHLRMQARMQAIMQAIKETFPATSADRLRFTGLPLCERNAASGESVEKLINKLRTWKLAYVIDGGFRVRIDHRNQIVLNCNEMVRRSLEGRWVQQASQLRCSLVSAGGGEVQVKELTTKADVFNVIRAMGGADWTENALQTLDKWMRIGERWNKRRFSGSGGFTMDSFVDNNLLTPPEHFEMQGGSAAQVASDPSDIEDVDDLVNDVLLK